ncbi:MAG: (deoxy)nucleoside triphosphate pyrophosphohydrolase [Polyangiales bacterium]
MPAVPYRSYLMEQLRDVDEAAAYLTACYEDSDLVHIAAAIIEQSGRILITRRPEGAFMGGLWEFPGGKVEPGESAAMAVVRECWEECALEVAVEALLNRSVHRDAQRPLQLDFFRCRLLGGTLRLHAATAHAWVTAAELVHYPMPPANRSVCAYLMQAAEANTLRRDDTRA